MPEGTRSARKGSLSAGRAVLFGTIARVAHEDRVTGLAMLRSADEAFELKAVTEDLFVLAPRVLAKHRYVNKGWVAAGAGLLLLLAAAASTVIAA